MNESLLQYETVQRWFRQLRKKASAMENGGVPQATKELALYALEAYCSFTKMNPDQLIADAENEMRTKGNVQKHCDMLDKFWENYKSKTTASVAYRYLRSFYKRNGIVITGIVPEPPRMREQELIPTSEQIRAICDVAPLAHKTWILTDNYTGLRIGAFPELKVENFATENWTQDKPLYPVYIPERISGTFSYVVFIGNDCKNVLQTYFNVNKFKKQDHPWDYDTGYMRQKFKQYAYIAGVIDAPEGLNRFGVPKGLCPLRPHSLRKRLQTILEAAHVPLNWVDYMLGHVPRGAQAQAYSRPTEQQLYNAYLQALPRLEIYGHHKQSPALPSVEMQRMLALEQIKRTFNLSPEKMEQIRNLLWKVRTEKEIKEALQNIMTFYRKTREENAIPLVYADDSQACNGNEDMQKAS